MLQIRSRTVLGLGLLKWVVLAGSVLLSGVQVEHVSVSLCCPVGQVLNNLLICEPHPDPTHNTSEEIIRSLISDALRIPLSNISLEILAKNYRPITTDWGEDYVTALGDSSVCIDKADQPSPHEVFHVEETREVNVNFCCQTGEILNTETGQCEAVNSTDFIVGIRALSQHGLALLPYTAKDFLFEVKKIECQASHLKYLTLHENSCFKDNTCFNPTFYINQNSGVTRSELGTIQHKYGKEVTCIAPDVNGRALARICFDDPCAKNTCVTKCCPEGQYFDAEDFKCTDGESPTIKVEVIDENDVIVSDSVAAYAKQYGTPSCDYATHIGDVIDTSSKPKKGLQIHQKNASLRISTYFNSSTYDVYCIDQRLHEGTYSMMAIICSAFTEDAGGGTDMAHHTFLGSLMLVSCFFLSLTILVHLVLPELWNIGGISIICYSSSLFINFLIFGLLNLGISPDLNTTLCHVWGLTAYYFFFSSFVWLSIMAVDLCLASRLRYASCSRRIHWKMLSVYLGVGWGIPLMFTLFVIVMDSVDLPYYVPVPHFGLHSCWFYDSKLSIGLYLYAPVSVFLLFNLCCFVYLAAVVLFVKETALTEKQEKRGKERIWTILKLFVLMGVTWIFEVISFAVGGPSHFWYFTDTINILKSVLVFIIVVCRRKVLRLLANRYSCIKSLLLRVFRWSPDSGPEAPSSSSFGSMEALTNEQTNTDRSTQAFAQ